MMGRSHLLVGAAAFPAVGAPLAAGFGSTMSVEEIACGTVVCAGAAMLPDVDHPKASIAQSLGPVSYLISKATSKVFGGHRNGTHSLLFALLVAGGSSAAMSTPAARWFALGACLYLASLALRTLAEIDVDVCAALSAAVAVTLITVADPASWFVWAVGFGCLAHMAADAITPEGVPPLWPVSKLRLSVPLISHTGDWRERGIAWLCGAAACVLLAQQVFIPLWERDDHAAAAYATTAPEAQVLRLSGDGLVERIPPLRPAPTLTR